jgi:hypothetical protein
MPYQSRMEALIILVPVYNDWDAVEKLIPLIDASVAGLAASVQLVLVNDGSNQARPETLGANALSHLSRVDLVHLRRNLGNQRALAVGLSHVFEHMEADAVLVMDGDGEDSPDDIPSLVSKYHETEGRSVVFAARQRRSENMLFRISYFFYRACHRLLTGRTVRVGNFSLIPWPLLDGLVVVSDLWNHYAASVYKARLPTSYVPTNRGPRLAGKSKMNFVSLATHGLSAISVFSELAGVRLLLTCSGLCLLSLAGLVVIIVQAVTTDGAFPWRAAFAGSMLLLLFLQMGLYALLACFITLGSRTSALFIPQRDHVHFIGKRETIFGAHE